MALTGGITLLIFISSMPISNKAIAQLIGLTQLLLLVVFVVWHGTMRYGLRGLSVFMLITLIVSNITENLSIATGVPFGNYHYVSGTLPFLFEVPIPVALAYCAYGYLAWAVANVLLGRLDERIKSWAHTIILPLTASFIMVMWDVVMDPINSTVRQFWIWEEGGGYNGVPLTNYLGWFLTVYLFYQAFALYLRKRSSIVRAQTRLVFWATPVVLYGVTGLSFVVMHLVAGAGTVTDATGYVWDKQNIYETAAIVSLFTMVFTAFLATVKIFRAKN